MRDHFFESKKLDQSIKNSLFDFNRYRNSVQVKFELIYGSKIYTNSKLSKKKRIEIKLIKPNTYQTKPQKIDNHYHIPVIGGQWYCI